LQAAVYYGETYSCCGYQGNDGTTNEMHWQPASGWGVEEGGRRVGVGGGGGGVRCNKVTTASEPAVQRKDGCKGGRVGNTVGKVRT